MEVQREYGKLIAIVCHCCSDEFHPEWDDEADAEGDTSLSIAIAQAEVIGWEQKGDTLLCPRCSEERA